MTYHTTGQQVSQFCSEPRRLTIIRAHYWRDRKSVKGENTKPVVVVPSGETREVPIVVPGAARKPKDIAISISVDVQQGKS